jgi:hypothetical protein
MARARKSVSRTVAGGERKTAPAAKRTTKPYCGLAPRPVPHLPDSVLENPLRAAAILESHSKWLNGVVPRDQLYGENVAADVGCGASVRGRTVWSRLASSRGRTRSGC